MNKILEKLQDAFDIAFNDTILTVGSFVFTTFTVIASLYYAVTNALPVIPQWAWGGIFMFMLVAGVSDFENLVYLGTDEEDDDLEGEDEEIVKD